MMKYYIALLLCLQISLLSEGQRVFRNGYIITLTGDTIYGRLGKADWSSPARHFIFKPAGTGQSIKCTVENTREVVIPREDDYISNYQDNCGVFSEMLVDGDKVQLFQCPEHDGEGTQFYLRDSTRKRIITLQRKSIFSYYADLEDDSLKAVSTYKDQLMALFPNVLGAEHLAKILINQAYYNKEDLSDVILEINRHYGAQTDGNIYKNGNISFFMSIGESKPILNMQGQTVNFGKLNFSTPATPYLALGFDFNSKWVMPRFTIRTLLTISSGYYSGHTPQIHPAADLPVSYTIHEYTLSPSFGLLYNVIPFGSHSWFYIGADFSGDIYMYSKNLAVINVGPNSKTTWDDYLGMARYGTNLTAKAGVFLIDRKWEINAFCKFYGQVGGDADYFQMYQHTIGLGTGYHFK